MTDLYISIVCLGVSICVVGGLCMVLYFISIIYDKRKELLEKKHENYEHIAKLIDGRFNQCERGFHNLGEVLTFTCEEVRNMKKLLNKRKSNNWKSKK